ncbi:MAG: DUF805 domain-containing protein [Thiotrichaceae bacterium]|nr:DUF805 domain-containing protein [Thiotrichaceae bacterium]
MSDNPYSTPESNPQNNLNLDNGKRDKSSPFSAKGRFGRLSFLAWNFVVGVILLVILIGIMFIGGMENLALDNEEMLTAIKAFYNSPTGVGVISVIFLWSIFTFLFLVRRLHDIGISGWWSVARVIPLVGIIFYIVILSKKGIIGTNHFAAMRITPLWEKVIGFISIIGLIPFFIIEIYYLFNALSLVYVINLSWL